MNKRVNGRKKEKKLKLTRHNERDKRHTKMETNNHTQTHTSTQMINLITVPKKTTVTVFECL